jgi:hypothetical protein
VIAETDALRFVERHGEHGRTAEAYDLSGKTVAAGVLDFAGFTD